MDENKIQELGQKYGIDQESIDEVKEEYGKDMEYDSGKLTSFIERIENLEAQKKEFSDDIREVFAEAKGQGYDVKAIKQVLKLRKMLPADRAEYTFLTNEYSKLLGLET